MKGRNLIVGGTGMLAGVTGFLLNEHEPVSVLSRGKVKLKQGGGAPQLLKLDYNDQAALEAALAAEVAADGPFERSICWVHSPNEERVCRTVAQHTQGLLLHIMGSSAHDPNRPEVISTWQQRFQDEFPNLVYRIVVLGFFRDEVSGRTRWLTHEEISKGVIAALDNPQAVQVVGVTEPWGSRP